MGGPVTFEAGKGEFVDSPEGRETMLFAAEEGSRLTVATTEGFKSNGMTALDNSDIRGSFEGNKDLIVQNSQIDVDGAKFTGEVTVVNQQLGHDADGMELATDADVDAVALTPVADEQAGLTGAGRREAVMPDGPDTDSPEYREHIDNILAHELGENFGDTVVQNHENDIHDKMHGQLLEDWNASPENTTSEDFYESHRNSSEYQAGINDAPTEDRQELMSETGMTMDEIDAALTEQDGGRKIASRDAWQQFSQVRADHQPEAHQDMTSGHGQRELGGDGSLNPEASEGLLNKETELTGKSTAVKKNTAARNLGSLGEIANKAKEAEGKGKGKDDGPDR